MLQPDDFFAALADATRRRILALLQDGAEHCLCVLYETLDLPQPKVSRHLGVLLVESPAVLDGSATIATRRPASAGGSR